MSQTLFTFVPGQSPIELFEYYEEFKSYYPFCELQTKRWFVQNVEPSWCILDVGANIGYYSILFSRLAPAGRVIAFEPTRTIEKLKTNLARHGVGNVEVEPIAIGNQIGRLEDAIFRVWGQEAERNFYDFETIDHYRERRQIRIDCIKIDTGSFDFEVLMGAERTLLDCNPWIVVELNHALSRRNQSVAQALEWLNARGYLEALVLDYDNYLLKRRSPETGCATGLRLFFDQHRIDREHDLTLADAIDNAIDLSPIFHNHARLDDSLAVPGILSAVAFGPQWSYAVSLKLTQLARESGPGAVRAMLIVTRGTIGVGCLTPGGRNYVGEEVNLTAASEPQEAVIVLRNLSDAHSVVFRNTHPGDMESHFVLVSLDVFRMRVNTPREKPSYMLRGATRISLQELRAQVEAASNSQ